MDRVEALKWLTLAANQGQIDAAARIPSVKDKMSKDEVAEVLPRVRAFSGK